MFIKKLVGTIIIYSGATIVAEYVREKMVDRWQRKKKLNNEKMKDVKKEAMDAEFKAV